MWSLWHTVFFVLNPIPAIMWANMLADMLAMKLELLYAAFYHMHVNMIVFKDKTVLFLLWFGEIILCQLVMYDSKSLLIDDI